MIKTRWEFEGVEFFGTIEKSEYGIVLTDSHGDVYSEATVSDELTCDDLEEIWKDIVAQVGEDGYLDVSDFELI